MLIGNNHVSFHLWWTEIVLKQQKVSQYFESGCRSTPGHRYNKYKTRHGMIMITCIKKNLSNIWSSIHKKVKQHWGWVEKNCCL